MQPDPTIHLWMHEQELQRTLKENALLRAARANDKPAARFRASRIREGLASLRRSLTPASTGSA